MRTLTISLQVTRLATKTRIEIFNNIFKVTKESEKKNIIINSSQIKERYVDFVENDVPVFLMKLFISLRLS